MKDAFFSMQCVNISPTKLCNPNKNYIVRTVSVIIMHGGIRFLLTGAAEDEIDSLSTVDAVALGCFLISSNVRGWYLPKKINGTGTSKNSTKFT